MIRIDAAAVLVRPIDPQGIIADQFRADRRHRPGVIPRQNLQQRFLLPLALAHDLALRARAHRTQIADRVNADMAILPLDFPLATCNIGDCRVFAFDDFAVILRRFASVRGGDAEFDAVIERAARENSVVVFDGVRAGNFG